MHRLIDADDLFAKVDALENATAAEWGWQEMCDGISQAKTLILEAPTIDAQPVVRCKDCAMMKSVFDSQCQNEQCYCNVFKCWVNDEGFCSSGRKGRCDSEH